MRDVYPIPHIEQILESLHSKELFTVFDVHIGYNNVLIKAEDQWKVAFKMPYGLSRFDWTLCLTWASLVKSMTSLARPDQDQDKARMNCGHKSSLATIVLR
jgi:hypothetical protein